LRFIGVLFSLAAGYEINMEKSSIPKFGILIQPEMVFGFLGRSLTLTPFFSPLGKKGGACERLLPYGKTGRLWKKLEQFGRN
jgi:hypothetical protein